VTTPPTPPTPPTIVKIPHCTPGQWPSAIATSRFASHVHTAMITGCRVALLGLPDDTGVKLNNGRPGAADGPAAFRDALARYGVMDVADWTYPKVFDAGDVQPVSGTTDDALLATHARVREAVRAILDLGLFPIAIGGGHDLTCAFAGAVIDWHRERASNTKANSNAAAAADADDNDEDADPDADAPTFGCVYCDAHLDLRAQIGSGMPFRTLIERHNVAPLLVEGLDPFANTREFLDYFEDHMGHIAEPDEDPQERYDEVFAETPHIVASFDLDAIDMAFAPGVSAMNPSGMNPAEAQRHVQRWGSDPRVICFDIMELSPTHDENARTSRLAARLFLAFLAAWSTR
jgi:arginase family enzyme